MKVRRRLSGTSVTALLDRVGPGAWMRGLRRILAPGRGGDDWLGRIHETALTEAPPAAPSPGTTATGAGRAMPARRHRPPGLGWFQPGVWLHTLRYGHIGWRFGTTFAGSLVGGYLFAVFVLFPAPIFTSSLAVPDLLGRSVEDAEEALAEAGLTVGQAEGEPHPTVPRSQIVWHDPPAGMTVPEGTIVRLYVSTGPQRIPVPDVAGYDHDVARLLIESAGLTVERVEAIQTAAPKDVTVNTRPAPGATLRPGTGVTLVVSVGAPTIQVPDLAGLTLDESRGVLEEAGLVLGTNFRQTSVAQPEGTVFRQEPSAGTLLAPGAAVNVILARRPQ